MNKNIICVPGVVLLLIACILVAGCDSSPATNQTVQPGVTTGTGALYSEGDIVRNPVSTADTAWLVLDYDDASDTYERALIYKNADGSWGYRKDNRTEQAKRPVMEKVYSDIVENKLPSSIPIVTPTPAPTEPAAASTTRSVAAATPTASTAPSISRIIPDKGDAGTTVQVTDLVGSNLQNGANVTLRRSGSNEIYATGVRAVTPKSITCTFAIPADAAAGAWDVVVKNPDGQSYTYTNIFSVHRTAVSSLTTSATSGGTVPITYIDPSTGHVSNNQISVTGSNFQKGASVSLQKTGRLDITAREVVWISNSSLTCFIDIPSGSFGSWDFRVTNPDQSFGVNYGAFSIV